MRLRQCGLIFRVTFIARFSGLTVVFLSQDDKDSSNSEKVGVLHLVSRDLLNWLGLKSFGIVIGFEFNVIPIDRI